LTVFNEVGTKLFGISANELQQYKENNDPAFDTVLDAIVFRTGIFTIKIKEEPFNETMKQRCTLINFRPIDFVEESAALIRAIKSYGTGR
jgi:replication factor A1